MKGIKAGLRVPGLSISAGSKAANNWFKSLAGTG